MSIHAVAVSRSHDLIEPCATRWRGASTADPIRTLTIRPCETDARKAEWAGRADDVSVNEVVRRALHAYFEARRQDPEFMARSRELLAADSALIEGAQCS